MCVQGGEDAGDVRGNLWLPVCVCHPGDLEADCVSWPLGLQPAVHFNTEL